MADDVGDRGRELWARLAARGRGDALETLSDVGALRRLLDRIELDAVRDARAGNRSWAEIATRLGVTRQSAWERWRDLDAEPARPSGVVVPDVVGLTWEEARDRLRAAGLFGVTDDLVLPLLDPAEVTGLVVTEQKPAAGERVAAHGVVTLWLRRGPGSAGVPAPLEPRPDPRALRGAIDETTGDSVR